MTHGHFVHEGVELYGYAVLRNRYAALCRVVKGGSVGDSLSSRGVSLSGLRLRVPLTTWRQAIEDVFHNTLFGHPRWGEYSALLRASLEDPGADSGRFLAEMYTLIANGGADHRCTTCQDSGSMCFAEALRGQRPDTVVVLDE